jgi:hypothetical protein
LSNSEIISGKKNRNIKEALTELLGPASQMADVEAKHITPKFLPAFEGLFKALALRPKPFDPGLPKVMMVTLSHRLLEVLLLWAITQSDIDPETIELQRADLLRFVMFWRLCVTHEDKASTQCFINIRINGDQLFPAAKLCDAILEFHEPIAIRLLAPDKLRKIVCRGEASDVWRTYPERFPDEPNPESVMARLWWKSGKDSLIWLQRDYLQNRFKEFDPASGRDDETPYDLDHMVPSSDWGRNWQTFKKAVRGVEIESFPSMQYSRSLLGCSIGNLRLIDYAENRSKSNAPFAKSALQPAPDSDSGATEVLNATEPHMQNEFVRKTPEEWEAYYPDMAFDPEQKELWRKASGDDEQLWTADRLTAFQQAVEERAAWLYEQFYSGLGFASWESKFLKDAPPAQ